MTMLLSSGGATLQAVFRLACEIGRKARLRGIQNAHHALLDHDVDEDFEKLLAHNSEGKHPNNFKVNFSKSTPVRDF